MFHRRPITTKCRRRETAAYGIFKKVNICLPLGFVFLHNKNLDFAICLQIMHVVTIQLRFEICQLKFATGIFTKTSRIHFSHLARSLTGKNWKIINSSLICLQIYFKFFVILKRKPLSLKKTMIWLTFFNKGVVKPYLPVP